MVIADADAFSTALVNLLENALKYTTDDKRIGVRASADGGGFVRFDVTDNGIGIPAVEQRRIFRGSIASINGCRARPPASASVCASSI